VFLIYSQHKWKVSSSSPYWFFLLAQFLLLILFNHLSMSYSEASGKVLFGEKVLIRTKVCVHTCSWKESTKCSLSTKTENNIMTHEFILFRPNSHMCLRGFTICTHTTSSVSGPSTLVQEKPLQKILFTGRKKTFYNATMNISVMSRIYFYIYMFSIWNDLIIGVPHYYN